MGDSGSIPFGEGRRERAAAAIAGAFAEAGIAVLAIADPRACRAREVVCRATNLPAELLGAEPGTTFGCEGAALLVEQERIRWAAEGELAGKLRAAGEDAALEDELA